MTKSIVIGGCVKIPDGRIARVRERINNQYRVRVRRQTSASHQFLFFKTKELTPVDCPKGWMSVEGYKRYLEVTLAKMKIREKNKN
jgi:hypothetical protein